MDWPYFARWHYRSHHIGFLRRVILLWRGDEPVGICLFAAPAASLALRTQYFGLSRPRSRIALQALNQKLWLLQRVVIHPVYRGAGVAAAFVHTACRLCPVDWIETLSAMGHASPFFERAGFTRVGTIRHRGRHRGAAGAYAARHARLSVESEQKSRFSEPVYYVFDNRKRKEFSPPIPMPLSYNDLQP